MKILLFHIAILLSAAGPAAAPKAAPPAPKVEPLSAVVPRVTITGATSRPAYRTIMLDGSASDTVVPLFWKLAGYSPDPTATAGYQPKLILFDQALHPQSYAVVLDPEPGRYTIAAVAVGTDNDDDGRPDVAIDIVEVTVNPTPPLPVPPAPPDPTPPPEPPPHPDPPPGPIPPVVPSVAGPVHASLILDRDAMTLPLAALRADAEIKARTVGLKSYWHVYEIHSPDIDKYGFRPFIAKSGGPPCLVIQDSTGKVLGVRKDFNTADDIIKIITIYANQGRSTDLRGILNRLDRIGAR